MTSRRRAADSRPTVLLTLGRLPKALEIARSFASAGWRVLVAEPFERHLCAVSRAVDASHVVAAPAADRERYLSDLLALVEREGVQLVVPVSEEAMHAAFLAERLPAGVRMYAMPPARLLELHDKRAFVDVARRYGLSAPDTAALGDPRAPEIAASGPYVVKPVYSCSGRGVQFRGATDPLPAVDDEPAIVQRFVAGDVRTSFTLADRGRVQRTIVYRGVVMSGTVAVCFERVPALPAVEAWVERFVECSQWSGFLSFDFVVDADGRAHAIECNPRATSGIHFVHPDDLARAIATPEDRRPVRHRAVARLQQLFPCLTETQRSLFADRPKFRSNLRHLLTTRDVAWDSKDPWPLLSMPATSWQIIQLALRQRRTFGEVATLDVGWYAAEASTGAAPDARV
jgi:predicted ATP-grasp superfamily ATP-dependent carboligase